MALETTLHTVPVDDWIEHDTDGAPCVCGASVELFIGADGSSGKLVVHSALDGRELTEAGLPIPREPGGGELRIPHDPGE
jgi:hypothetical protein